jgi:hypothetical protein
MRTVLSCVGIILLILVGGFLLIQLVPYGRAHANPPVVKEPAWDSPTTRALAKRACFDCHSNETVWPWYTNVAPVSCGGLTFQTGRARAPAAVRAKAKVEAVEATKSAERSSAARCPPGIT